MEINYFSPPEKSEDGLREYYFSPSRVFCMDDVLSSNKEYREFFQDLLDILKYGFEKEEVRKHEIKFRLHKGDKKIHKMQIRHLVTNLIFWRCLINIDKVELLDESFFFDAVNFSPKTLKKYIDEKLLPIHDGDFASMNAMVDDICHAIVCISHAFCLLMGMSFSVYNLIETEKRHPEITELISGTIDQALPPNEIEKELDERTQRLMDILIHDEQYNDLKPPLVGNMLKKEQFREFAISIGYKSDISGHTIPLCIAANFLVHGLSSPSSLYINALGGRKALILTKTRMGEPGAFAKKVSQVSTSVSRLGTEECCDSVGYILYNIRDDLFLKLLNGRYYYDQYGNMKLLNYKQDKHLIGKVVPFRSPVTCSGHDGICKACYGHLYELNREMFSVGCLAA